MQRLVVPVRIFSSAVAWSTVTCFPGLTALELIHDWAQGTRLDLSSVNVLTADSPAAVHLSRLAQLRSLQLGSCSGPGWAAVLPALTSLTELSLDTTVDEPWLVEAPMQFLLKLTLESGTLHIASYERLPALHSHGAARSSTELSLGSLAHGAAHTPFLLEAPVPALRMLTLCHGMLNVASFAQLPALQSLDVSELSSTGKPPPGGWQLPQRMYTLKLGMQLCPKVLTQLRVPTYMAVSISCSLGNLANLQLYTTMFTADGRTLSLDSTRLDAGRLIGSSGPVRASPATGIANAALLRAAVVALYKDAGSRGVLELREIPCRAPRVRAVLRGVSKELAAAGVKAHITLLYAVQDPADDEDSWDEICLGGICVIAIGDEGVHANMHAAARAHARRCGL